MTSGRLRLEWRPGSARDTCQDPLRPLTKREPSATMISKLIPILLLGAAPLFAQGTNDWPWFQGPNLDGTLGGEGVRTDWPEEGPKVLWTAKLGRGFGGAAVRDGEVYLFDREVDEADVMRVYDLKTGEELWTFRYECAGRLSYDGSRAVPNVQEKHVYLIGGFGHVHCVDRKLHEIVWKTMIPDAYGAEMPRWGWAQSALVLGDLVIIAALGEDVGLVALNRETGEEVWKTEGVGSSHSTPTIVTLDGVQQVLFVGTKGVYSFDPKSGDTLWMTGEYTNRIPIPAPIKIDEERLFITGGYGEGSLMVRVKKNGEEGYSVEELFRLERGSQIQLPILIGEHLYMLGNENDNSRGSRNRATGGLQCYDLDGKQLWKTGDDPFLGRGNMIKAGDMLFIQNGESASLVAVKPSPEKYQQLGELMLFGKPDAEQEEEQPRGRRRRRGGKNAWAPMALSGGLLLIRSQDELKCVDLRSQKDDR